MNVAQDPNPDSDSHERNSPCVEQGEAQYLFVADVGWSIDLAGVRRELSGKGASASEYRQDSDLETLNLPVPPVLVASSHNEEFEIAGFKSSPRANFLITDTGAISAKIRFPLNGHSLAEIKRLAHELDSEAQNRLQTFGHELVSGLVGRISSHIEEQRLGDEVQTYRVFKLKTLENGQSALTLLDTAKEDLAHILKGEVEALAPEQIEDALSIASSYYAGERTIIETRNAVLLGNASFRDVGTVLGFAVVELLELRVLERLLENYLESDRLTVGRQREDSGLPFKIRRFDLAALDQIQQEASIQLGRALNPLKLLDDHYDADVREKAAKRLGLDRWADQIHSHLDTLREIGTDLSNHKQHRAAFLIELGVFLLVAYEVYHGITHE